MDLLSRISDSIQGSVAARARTSGRWGVRFACDFAAGFHVLLQGHCLVQCNTTNQILEMQPGDIVFFARGYYHELKSDASVPCVDVQDFRSGPSDSADETCFLSGRYQFPQGPLHPLFRALPEYFHISGTELPLHDPIRSLVQILSVEFSRQDSSELILSRITDTLFHCILRHWMLENDTSSHWAMIYSDEAVLRAIEAMEDRLDADWSVASLAGAQGLSRATLARRFKEVTRMGPMEYLAQIRMQRAARLLQKSDRTVEQISLEVGYESPFSFSRSFKKVFGMAPREFRKTAIASL
ncbi:MAG: AraC family transcriptional regulator [Leptospiraceae bacterium]|nr:AraC family transcriptional regulator [Leptospiraceae bacterium]